MVGGNMFNGVVEGIINMLMIGIISCILLICFIGYFVYDKFIGKKEIKIESKVLIVPEIKLTTDGKTIDTIYVYKLKK